ncbi:MAG TPA: hypothetical protein VIK77_03770 [Tissierellaceae bacterium]
MDIMLELEENIKNEKFYKLLDLCFKVSTYFSFTENSLEKFVKSENHANFLKKLEPFFVKSYKVNHWHAHYYISKGNERNVYIFRIDDLAKQVIKDEFDNIFLLKEINGKKNFTDLPEDLCFFLNKKLFLGTVTHGFICTAYPFSEKIYKDLLELGKWKTVKYSDEEQIMLDL